MIKNLTSNQLVLIALAAVLLLIAGFSFYLLQDPAAGLPFFPLPATATPTSLSVVSQATAVKNSPTPTRRISYTPLFAFATPALGTPSESPLIPVTPGPGTTIPAATPSPIGSGTPSKTITPPVATPSSTVPSGTVSPSPTTNLSPTATKTLEVGEISVTGRIIQNGTPMPNVTVSFADDVAPRQSITNPGGHFSFVTLAPGADFVLTFKQSDNPGLSPASDIASLALIQGTLPNNANPIDFPDLEISLNLGGSLFQPVTPVDGAAYSASAISPSTLLPFSWTLYSLGGSYKIELGPNSADQPTWTSSQLAGTTFSWDGTLTDGTHISAGNYWWRVAVTRSAGNYIQVIYTQKYDLEFNP